MIPNKDINIKSNQPNSLSDLSNDAAQLPVLNKLITNGRPTFGVFKSVHQINYMDYHSHLISQKSVSNWRKDLKANQFAFVQIVHPPFRVCIAVATIKLATTAFAYVYNEHSNEIEIIEALQPFTANTQLEGDHNQGKMVFKHAKLSVQMLFSPDTVTLNLDCSAFSIRSHLLRGDQPLAVCSPSGRRGWTFTQKEPFKTASGELTFHKPSKFYDFKVVNEETATSNLDASQVNNSTLVFNSATAANLDWTLGFMRHETNWFWCCINDILADDKHFALNLSMGVNETGVSENACWIDGEIYHLPPVMFDRDAFKAENNKTTDVEAREFWRIGNQNLGWSTVEINLIFEPIKVYKKTDNYGLIASIFEQWIGLYSGYIIINSRIGSEVKQQEIKIDKVMGLAEDHYAKW